MRLHPDHQRVSLTAFPVERFLADGVLRVVERSGVSRTLAELSLFTAAEARTALEREVGYAFSDPTRERMLDVLLDFLACCGLVSADPAVRRWQSETSGAFRLGDAARAEITGAFPGQAGFFARCLAYVDTFLKGSAPLFSFGNGSAAIWHAFLGNGQFGFARGLLVKLLLAAVPSPADALDLCYGPGFDLRLLELRLPAARLTALDFTEAFGSLARGNLREPDRVRWLGPDRWGGFGHPLPFGDGSFDLVMFTCADPYVASDRREELYADIYRILRPGGVLGILTNSYPDAGRAIVSEEWVARGTLCHDFLESVCEGWQGFHDGATSTAMFRRVGFTVDAMTLQGSLWRLLRPAS